MLLKHISAASHPSSEEVNYPTHHLSYVSCDRGTSKA